MDGFDWTITYDPGKIVLDAVSPASSGGGGGSTNAPEPSSLFLVVLGIFALGVTARRSLGAIAG
jgi:PEP-CTERM motif